MNPRRTIVLLAVCVGLAACAARGSETASRNDNRPTERTTAAAAPTTSANPSTADAVDAAVRFVCSGQRLLDTAPTQLPTVIRELWSARAADSAVTETVEHLAALRERLADGDGPTRYRQSVLATRVDTASPARVTVSVWWVGVLSRTGAAIPQAQWATSELTLVVEDGDWRVDAVAEVVGPTPDHSSDTEPVTNDEFDRRLTGFVDWESNR